MACSDKSVEMRKSSIMNAPWGTQIDTPQYNRPRKASFERCIMSRPCSPRERFTVAMNEIGTNNSPRTAIGARTTADRGPADAKEIA